MPEYDEDCLACTYDEHDGPYYDDHVHKTDVYPTFDGESEGGCGDDECCPDSYETDNNVKDSLYTDNSDHDAVTLNQEVYDLINGQFTTKDSGQREQYASGMQRDVTEGKTKWHLIASGPMLQRWAELMTRGAEKYDDDNWMKANSFDEYVRFRQSAYRHFMQWYMGHDDEDHAAAVIFNMNGAEYVKGMLT